jgi:hypothetical protein
MSMEETTGTGWQRIVSGDRLRAKRQKRLYCLWNAANDVATSTKVLWSVGDSLSRVHVALTDPNYPTNEEYLYAEGFYEPDPLEIWSKGVPYAYGEALTDADVAAEAADAARARALLTDFNEIAARQGLTDHPRVVCVRTLLEQIVALNDAPPKA